MCDVPSSCVSKRTQFAGFSSMTPVIDVSRDLDEKLASAKLEKLSRQSNVICMFTVVTNAFQALECTENTDYDAIFVADNLESLKAYDLLRILRAVGASVPVVYLLSRREEVISLELRGLPASGFDRPTFNFSGVLPTPYSCQELCSMIHSICFKYRFDSESSEQDSEIISSHPFDTASPFPYALSNTNTNTNSGTLDGIHLMEYYSPTIDHEPLIATSVSTTGLNAMACVTPTREVSAFGTFKRFKG